MTEMSLNSKISYERIKYLGTFFGGHVRFVFTIVLFIFVLCVVTTITSFNEIPLDFITNPFKVIGNYLDLSRYWICLDLVN